MSFYHYHPILSFLFSVPHLYIFMWIVDSLCRKLEFFTYRTCYQAFSVTRRVLLELLLTFYLPVLSEAVLQEFIQQA